MWVTGSGALLALMMAGPAAGPVMPIPAPAAGGAVLSTAQVTPEPAPAPGTLLQPLQIDIEERRPGWRVARLEVLLDGVLLAERNLTATEPTPTAERSTSGEEEAWSGPVAAGDHLLEAVLVMHRTGPEESPTEMRVQRAHRFRTGPSEALALLIQAPPGKQSLQLGLSRPWRR